MSNYTMIRHAVLLAFAIILWAVWWAQPPALSEHETYLRRCCVSHEAQR